MKKALVTIFGIVLVLLLLGVLAWNMLPAILSRHLSRTMDIPVSVANITFSTSKIQVDIIRLGNPKGYDRTPYALSINKLTLNLPFSRLFSRHIVVDKMWLKDVYIGLELDSPFSTEGNWTTIVEHMSKNASTKAKSRDTTLLVKKLVITNLNTTLAYKMGKRSLHELQTIENIELNNVSSEGGFPTKQIINIIIKRILEDVLMKEAIQRGLSPLKDQTEKGIDAFKKLFSQLPRGLKATEAQHPQDNHI